MRYVGVDPSTKTGLVIMDQDGTVIEAQEITSSIKKDPERFIGLVNKIFYFLKEGDTICIEGFSYGSRGKGVSTQYGIGWLIRAELVRNGYTYHEVAPTAVKKFATGKGTVKKDAMVLPIFKHWGFENDSDNVRDAYILAQIARATKEKILLTNYQIETMKKVI